MKRTIIILVVTLLIVCYAFGQDAATKIDSLENLLSSTDNTFQKAYIRSDIARAASGIDSIKAYGNAREALDFFRKKTDSFGLAKAYAAMGYVVFDYGEMKKSQEHYEKAKLLFERQMKIDSSKKMIDLWADTALNLAASIGNQGRANEEMQYLMELAPVVKKYKNYKVLALINSNLAISFYNDYDFTTAYFYFNENHIPYERTKAYSQFAVDRLVFASCLMEMDSLPRAKKELDRAYALLQKTPESPRWHLYHQELGEYYSKAKRFPEALQQFGRSMKIIKNQKYYGALPQQYLQYVETYGDMGDLKKEKEYMVKFYQEVKKSNPPEELYALKELAKYENRDKNYQKAMAYTKAYFELNDSINADDKEKEAARLEKLYQKEKKDREILELQNLNNQTDLDLERKKSQNYLLFFLLGTLLFISIAGYLTYNNRQKKALLKEQVQAREIQQLKAEQERKLFGVMMEGVEQERKRLAADLHDGLGGRLSGISIKLSRLTENKEAKPLLPHLDDILGNLDDSLQELRGVARNLMPETLLKYGLKAAVEDYCSTLGDKETNITLQFYNTENVVDRNELLTLYRIIQELINNAIKHAKATEILVQCMVSDDKIDVTIEDDGKGFNLEDTGKNMGVGLTSLQNRVDYLNGIMDIRSEINEGTSINIQIEKT
ncbi:histidine kinase [Maribacter sp. 2308TA10-17]|uniref:tetratricopeptide repeat-containing sensor histidine kinase n=1 Tax=Maribacter sp. 2308TA10-17 TaxID=3386276 RepID=UPI0039BC832B